MLNLDPGPTGRVPHLLTPQSVTCSESICLLNTHLESGARMYSNLCAPGMFHVSSPVTLICNRL